MLFTGCAGGVVPASDAGGDASPDTETSYSNTMSPDTATTDGVTTVPDAGDGCGACCPGEVVCIDEGTIGRCRPDGSDYDETRCGEDTVCEEGACVTPSLCEPGELDCFDESHVLRCRQSGEAWVQMECDTGYVCSQGACTDKVPLGGGCVRDDDCATGNCRCGFETDDGCPQTLSGICADDSCTERSCGMNEYCFASAEAPVGAADYDHCVLGCDVDNPCPSGSRCIGVPTIAGDGTEYHTACYFEGAGGFGDDCSTAGECVSGDCLTGYFDVGFCTRRCDDDGACSDGAACVELRSGEYWCTLICGDGAVGGSEPCPLDEPTDRFDVTCKAMSVLGGGVLRVCATP